MSVSCHDGDIRLVNVITYVPNTIEGSVEVCYANQWGAVYATYSYIPWTLREASVVCRQLHYAPVSVNTYTTYKYQAKNGNFSFSDIYCIGYETKLTNCSHLPPGYIYSEYSLPYAVSVGCQGKANHRSLFQRSTVSSVPIKQWLVMNAKMEPFAWWVGTPVTMVGLRCVKVVELKGCSCSMQAVEL